MVSTEIMQAFHNENLFFRWIFNYSYLSFRKEHK